jgi:hypothetical protein
MGILVGTGRTGCTLLSLVAYTGRISGIMKLTRGRLLGLMLLALLVLTLPAVGITLLALPPGPLTIPAVGLPSLVLPLIPAAFPLWPVSLPATGISLLMLPLLVLPLSRVTTPAVGIARRMVLAIPAVGIAPWLLPLPRLALPAIGITTRLLKLSPPPLEPINIALRRLKLGPLPLEHIGIAPWRGRGKGPTTRLTRGRLIRPGQGA